MTSFVQPVREQLNEIQSNAVSRKEFEEFKRDIEARALGTAAAPAGSRAEAAAGSSSASSSAGPRFGPPAGPSSASAVDPLQGAGDPWLRGRRGSDDARRSSEEHARAMHTSGRNDWVPSEIYVQGWAPWGKGGRENAITKDRASKLYTELASSLSPDMRSKILDVKYRMYNYKLIVLVQQEPGVADRIAATWQNHIDERNVRINNCNLMVKLQLSPEEERRRGILVESIRAFEQWAGYGVASIAWKAECIKAGWKVLGRFDDHGSWKWSVENLMQATGKPNLETREFVRMSGDF
jgi:hypothetical protein